jgi:hypothetical protein
MTLSELEEEIAILVNDSSLAQFFKRWINEAVLDIAEDFALPALKLKEPATLEITTGSWLYELPNNYQKQLFRAGVFNGGVVAAENYMPLFFADQGFTTLDDLDPGHTLTDTHPWQVAVRDNSLGVYPKANDTLYLWFYEKPTPLKDPDDTPSCIKAAYHHRVIIPKLMIKNFRTLQDMIVAAPHQSIQYWQAELRAGLYGERGGDMGLVNVIARDNPPKRHGGRDPIWTGYRGGN